MLSLFRFVLALQYYEYINGLQFVIEKVSKNEDVKWSRKEHYLKERAKGNSKENELAIEDMRNTLKNFEVDHATYNQLIREELRKCSTKLK